MSVLTAGAPPRATLRYQLDTSLARVTPAERAERGKSARAAVPRESHAAFHPPPDRPDPLGLLEEQAEARVPELVPIRWGRMRASPCSYYRGAALRKMADKAMAKARTRDSMQEVAKLTRVVDGRPRIIDHPPLLVPVNDLLPAKTDQEAFLAQIKDLIATYRRTLETDRRYLLEEFQFADMARKVVDVCSVGTRCWIVLLLGRDSTDPLFLNHGATRHADLR